MCKAWQMSDPVIIILGLAAIAVLAVLYAWGMYASRHSARYPLRAIGVVALLVGLYVTGLAELALDGVRALIAWFRTETLDTVRWIGIGAGVLGILLFLIGGLITPPSRAEAKAARAERRAAAKAERATKPAIEQPATRPQPVPAPPRNEAEDTLVIPTGSTPAQPSQPSNPDDQVTAILKKHGLD